MELELNEQIDLLDVYEMKLEEGLPLSEPEKRLHNKLKDNLEFNHMSLKNKIKFLEDKDYETYYTEPDTIRIKDMIKTIAEHVTKLENKQK